MKLPTIYVYAGQPFMPCSDQAISSRQKCAAARSCAASMLKLFSIAVSVPLDGRVAIAPRAASRQPWSACRHGSAMGFLRFTPSDNRGPDAGRRNDARHAVAGGERSQ